jgi:quercetin dioxygenase-like cupin family protein
MANPGQISPLPGYTRYITSHNDAGQAIVGSEGPASWQEFEDKTLGFSIAYTTSEFPVNLNDNKDLDTHMERVATGNLGLVQPGGTVCRVVDFAPSLPGIMHRTQSLDYGIVLEGQIELVLDSGETRLMAKGDIAVQRATMHTWRNPSSRQWARMVFILQHCQPLVVGGKGLKEDLGTCKDIKPSE